MVNFTAEALRPLKTLCLLQVPVNSAVSAFDPAVRRAPSGGRFAPVHPASVRFSGFRLCEAMGSRTWNGRFSLQVNGFQLSKKCALGPPHT